MLLPRPSGSGTWGVCSASHGLAQKYSSEITGVVNQGAEEGTACHWVCEQILLTYINNKPILHASDLVGKLTPNNIAIDDEMFESADNYATVILRFIMGYLSVKDLHVEESVKLDNIYPKMTGTPDCWLYDHQTKTFYIWDMKYGYGIVNVFENKQLMIYISGILNLFPYDENYKIVLGIYQPRAFHPDGIYRTWEIMATDIRPHINKIHYMAHKAMSNEVEAVAGTHCRYCDARHACNALGQSIYNSIDVITGGGVNDLSGDDLSNELKLLNKMSELIKFRKVAIEEQVFHTLIVGKPLNGWKLQNSFGRKDWKAGTDISEVIQMGELMGVELKNPINLITPTQAIAKFKKLKLDTDVIEEYSKRPEKGMTLVEDDGSKMRQIFGRNKNNV